MCAKPLCQAWQRVDSGARQAAWTGAGSATEWLPSWHHSMPVPAHSPHLCRPQLCCHDAAQPCAAAKLQHAAAPDEGRVVH